ncbi:DUF3833 domain-containing protein [Amphritea pacifica]|uniref:DUF3833 domain-containing protein n=1 Tax=Amphritea pacifica TaxID=2811233 RepID=A0ABS2W7D2_9GAMM|nr:DUF3833 domain-containing protein [Amphritea pacifica]MBN0987510.1 DUF3833 domain-containing protein [Amphritea pacifica]MBN1005167.1 DUF3833 domain-containing protein [Amphritea pacifica]
MTQTTSLLALALPVLLILPGCASSLDAYRDEKPTLALDQFFNGRLVAYGMVQDFSGRVTRRFRADISAQWQEGKGVLDEQFYFSDGEQQSRCWTIVKEGNRYRGTAGDIVGEAQGEAQGNTLNWRYTLQVPVNGKVWNIALDDWLYLIDENNLINRTQMKKFGLPVGQLTLHIRKLADDEAFQTRDVESVCTGPEGQ